MPEATTADLLTLLADMEAMHAWRGWHWWPDADPFEVCVGCILVQNTLWSNVERAMDRLRAANALTPRAMAALSEEALAELIRPSGQFRQKAKKLRRFLDLADAHGGFAALMALPTLELRATLLATWGIGPETADAITLYAAHKPSFVIDAYTMRILTRLGIGPAGTDYRAWQRWFVDRMPADRDVYARFHSLIVLHAKHLCRKLRPGCGECTLVARCPYGQQQVRP